MYGVYNRAVEKWKHYLWLLLVCNKGYFGSHSVSALSESDCGTRGLLFDLTDNKDTVNVNLRCKHIVLNWFVKQTLQKHFYCFQTTTYRSVTSLRGFFRTKLGGNWDLLTENVMWCISYSVLSVIIFFRSTKRLSLKSLYSICFRFMHYITVYLLYIPITLETSISNVNFL